MILATQSDVEDRLRRALTVDEGEYIDALLEEASVLVEAWLTKKGITYTDAGDVPRVVAIVVSRMVARALTTETPGGQEGVTSLQAGQFSVRYGDPVTSSVFLSSSDMKWLANLFDSMVSIPLTSDRGWGS